MKPDTPGFCKITKPEKTTQTSPDNDFGLKPASIPDDNTGIGVVIARRPTRQSQTVRRPRIASVVRLKPDSLAMTAIVLVLTKYTADWEAHYEKSVHTYRDADSGCYYRHPCRYRPAHISGPYSRSQGRCRQRQPSLIANRNRTIRRPAQKRPAGIPNRRYIISTTLHTLPAVSLEDASL